MYSWWLSNRKGHALKDDWVRKNICTFESSCTLSGHLGLTVFMGQNYLNHPNRYKSTKRTTICSLSFVLAVDSILLSKPWRSKGYLKVMIDYMLYEMRTIILSIKVSDSFYDSPLVRSSIKNMAHSHGYKERSETVIMPLFLGEHDFVTFTIPQSSTVNRSVVFASFTTKSRPRQWSQLCQDMSPSMTASLRLPLHLGKLCNQDQSHLCCACVNTQKHW